jgi:hypothetical protein
LCLCLYYEIVVAVRVVLHSGSEADEADDPLEPLDPVPDVDEGCKGFSLLTRCHFLLLQPLQSIQHPLCLRLSFMNHTVKKKTIMNTAGTIRIAPLTVTLTSEHTNQNKNVKTTPTIA